MLEITRLRKLQEKIEQEKLDAFIVTNLADCVYLTGLSLEGYWLVAERQNWWVITNQLLDGFFRDKGIGAERLKIRMDFKEELLALVEERGFAAVGFDGESVSYALGKAFEEKGFKNCPKFFLSLRIAKDKEEIRAIKRACQITAKAMSYISKKLKPGAVEKTCVLMIEDFMKKHGAEKTSFDLIVASGPNSAVPHYKSGGRRLKSGDAVVVDIGCVYKNYCSDMTRTFFVGKKPSELFKKVYGVVAESQALGVKGLKPGIAGRDVDRLCRAFIEKAGFGEAFIHGTGHGIGLEIHEAPWVRKTSENIFGPGMVVTIEPGVYLPGKLGVRIEDTVLVTSNGAEVLTKYD